MEGAVVVALLTFVGFFYLRPASTELLRGNGAVMIGDNTDSVTNPWQYRLVLDVFKSRPQDLLFGAVYSDQINAPEGAASFIPFVERILVLAFAPFMSTDLMPTAMVWALMVLSGLSFYAFGRVLGWPRVVSITLALAWAFCPFMRARAVVHIGLVGTYWPPLILLALTLLARPPERWSQRRAGVVAGVMLLAAVGTAHYYVITAALLAPVFAGYYFLLLPRSASRIGALGNLTLAVVPSILFLAWNILMPVPSYGARALAPVATTRSETNFMLKVGGAHPTDYLAGDVKFGDRDLVPLRSNITRAIQAEVPNNRHERTNGIRWTMLAACAALAVTLIVPRFRRRFSRTERILGSFAFVLAAVAFLFALSPQGLRVYDVDLGPIQLANKIVPRFRVPNRIGVVVHCAVLLGAGVFLARNLRSVLARRSPLAIAVSVLLPLVVLLEYTPLHAMPLAPIRAPRTELETPQGCGYGITVPYVTYGLADEDYYRMMAEVRGTSCKILHATYLTREDEIMRLSVGLPAYLHGDFVRAKDVARCAGASWVVFRFDVLEDRKQKFCADMGWSFVSKDACRAPASEPARAPRSLRECVAELGLTVPPAPPAP